MSAIPMELDQRLKRAMTLAAGVGIVGCAGVMLLGFNAPGRVGPAYLVGYLFWVGMALGCLSLVMLHQIVGGNWGVVIRRPLEAGARTVPVLAVLFLPLVFWRESIYPWVRPEGEFVEVVAAKAAYLNVRAWEWRSLAYFVIWTAMAYLLTTWSRMQDGRTSTRVSEWSQKISGPGLCVVFFTASFAVIDWVMSLEPAWYSTIFSAMVIVGWGLATFALMIVTTRFLAGDEPMKSLATPERLNDLGNLMLAFTMLWAYLSFSQYLIIWAGNLSEEIPWYLRRVGGGWGYVAVSLVAFHFFLPFFILLSRDAKRTLESLIVVAGIVLFMRVVDLTWLVAPARNDPAHPTFALGTVLFVPLTVAAIGGVWLASMIWHLRGAALIPAHDPRVVEALEHAEEHHS